MIIIHLLFKFSVSTTVRDDQECEEAAVNNAKDTIKATSKEITELSEGKSSLQASTTVLEVNKIIRISLILLILPFFVICLIEILFVIVVVTNLILVEVTTILITFMTLLNVFRHTIK